MNARDFLLAKALDKGSGASLPTLSSPASASDIYQGTQAIDQAGAVVMGTNPYNAAVVDPIKASALTAIADKGVATTGDEALSEIPGLIDDIVTPNNQDKTITENGTYTADAGYTGLGTVTVDVASSGGGDDTLEALIERSITEINSNAEIVGSYAFYRYFGLTTANFPACTSIGGSAFYGCSSLTTVSFPACTSIGNGAFYSCTSLTTVSFPVCTSIGGSAFFNCSLTTANFPECTSIGSYAFFSCSSLTTVSFPVCTSIGNGAFRFCRSLTTANFPACTSIGDSAFYSCISLTTANFPVCTSIGNSAFYSCSLTTANFPECTSIGNNAFYLCRSLTTANFPACTSIGSSAFYSCYVLSALILSGSSLCTLANSNAFSNASLIQNGTGYIFVPASLKDAYRSATNWTYFSNQISAIEDSEFA